MRRPTVPASFAWDYRQHSPNLQWLRVGERVVACVGFHNGVWRSRVNMQLGDFRRERVVIAPSRELGAAWAERWALARVDALLGLAPQNPYPHRGH